jgi:Fe-S cluster assembly ATP-binding protein
MLKIKNLKVANKEKVLLEGINLNINKGEIHAIMGPNGAGKSTLAKVVAGHPNYEIKEGKILFEGEEIKALTPDKRAILGLLVSFQYPLEIAGLTTFDFLQSADVALKKGRGEKPLTKDEFSKILQEEVERLGLDFEYFIKRSFNEGSSGGEKKKGEVLQLLLFKPKLAILDEIDSGLDIDALKRIGEVLKEEFQDKKRSLLLISHYLHFLEFIQPDVVHIMIKGKIVHSCSLKDALEIEKKGFDCFLQEDK